MIPTFLSKLSGNVTEAADLMHNYGGYHRFMPSKKIQFAELFLT